jgi:hypothetical protein
MAKWCISKLKDLRKGYNKAAATSRLFKTLLGTGQRPCFLVIKHVGNCPYVTFFFACELTFFFGM